MPRTTTALLSRPDADEADPQTAGSWEPVKRALFASVKEPDEPVSVDDVLAVMRDVRALLAANRYAEVRAMLPELLRDATALNGEARQVQSRALNLTGWLMVQTRQWDSAEATLGLAIDAAAVQPRHHRRTVGVGALAAGRHQRRRARQSAGRGRGHIAAGAGCR